MWKHCPSEINSVIGYRTKRSKLSQETWKFAHENCGKRWFYWGTIMLAVTLILQIVLLFIDKSLIETFTLPITFVSIAVLLISIFPTEKALKEKFDEEGRSRE